MRDSTLLEEGRFPVSVDEFDQDTSPGTMFSKAYGETLINHSTPSIHPKYVCPIGLHWDLVAPDSCLGRKAISSRPSNCTSSIRGRRLNGGQVSLLLGW